MQQGALGAPARHLWHGFRALAPDSRRSSASHSALAAGDSRMGLQRTATCGAGGLWAVLRIPRGVIQSTRAVVTGEAGCRDVTGGQPDGRSGEDTSELQSPCNL